MKKKKEKKVFQFGAIPGSGTTVATNVALTTPSPTPE